MEFLSEDNICGQTLLRLTSRGSSIIAELFRLSKNIPSVFLASSGSEGDMESRRYTSVMFDFQFFKAPEHYERKINGSEDLLDLDDEFQETHIALLERFYNLFESIYKYINDYNQYLEDLSSGFFIQHTIDMILLDTDGRQLMCEALYLYGVMLLLLDKKIPGPTRERLIVSCYRYKGETMMGHVEEVCKLCKATGYLPGGSKPSGYPEELFSRFPVPAEIVRMIIARLQGDDVYLATRSFPSPSHRSTALATQASMLYVMLFFQPDILRNRKASMREMVDRHFCDNWIIGVYMGWVVDLSVEWAPYPAAREALRNTLGLEQVKGYQSRATTRLSQCESKLDEFLTEGILLERFVLDNIQPLLNCIRDCNSTLRWLLLHRRTQHRKFKDIIVTQGVEPQRIVRLLLNTSQLEFKLKKLFTRILDTKEERWDKCRADCSGRMAKLSLYFSGEMSLAVTDKDEQLQKWFDDMKGNVQGLEYGNSTLAGRKIQHIISALEEVEQFEEIDTSLQIKQYLADSRDKLLEMVRLANVTDDVMATLETVTDLSYAWELLRDYLPLFHARVRAQPRVVVLLRAMFLKLASILDVPLTRINQAASPDTISVAEYYSGELVAFVRSVLEVIPVTMFRILDDIIKIQTLRLRPLPIKLATAQLTEMAQLDSRYDLARSTHRVSVFTEGILAMEKTLLGIIQVDPRRVLEDGIRAELVRQITTAMHNTLHFLDARGRPKADLESAVASLQQRLDGVRVSFEYIQDYIGVYGMKIWLEEVSRIIQYHVEQERNVYLKKKVLDSQSAYQSQAIPIPRFPPTDEYAVNFMGRLVRALRRQTSFRTAVFAPECSGWYTHDGTEVAGIGTMALLNKGLGVIGLRGIDRLLSFRVVHELQTFVSFFSVFAMPPSSDPAFRHKRAQLLRNPTVRKIKIQGDQMASFLTALTNDLTPTWKLPGANPAKLYALALKKTAKLLAPMIGTLMEVGQAQLLRRQIGKELRFSAQLQSSLLSSSLETLNSALLLDIRAHYRDDSKPYPQRGNPILVELTKLLEATGIHDPLSKIYITSAPLEHLSLMLFLLLLSLLPRVVYDRNLVTLVRRKSSDGIDGMPLVLGLVTLLKQFHPDYTKQFLRYIGQYVRAMIHAAFSATSRTAATMPQDTLTALLFTQMFCKFADVPRSVIEDSIPAYIFDAISL